MVDRRIGIIKEVTNVNLEEFTKQEKISNEEFELISNIIKVRIENNLTQSDLAKLTGISQPNITRFEKNIHSASISTTIKILNALGYKLKIEKNKYPS